MDMENRSRTVGMMQAISGRCSRLRTGSSGCFVSGARAGAVWSLDTKLPRLGKRSITPSFFSSLRALETVMRLTW
nr:hypothetical protein [uncultured Acetatifactor sp.]